MRVSAVITNHNYARYLPAAIESALAQTHPAVDVVVVDDGSTDGSWDVIRRYGDAVRAVRGPARGQTAAMTAGLRASRGDLVCFLDADDFLRPKALEAAAAAFCDPRVLKAHWPLEEVNADGEPTGRLLPAGPLPRGALLDRLLVEGPSNLAFPPTSGNLFARTLLEDVMPLPELERELGVGSASADAYLAMVAAALGHVAGFDEPLGAYRRHDANDFAGAGPERTIARSAAVYDRHFALLAGRLHDRGVPVDVADWRAKSWFHRLQRVLQEVTETVASGGSWILVDDELTGLREHPAWRVHGFLERDGTYWGPAADAREAIAELERLKGAGASAVVFTWLARWWLEAYPELLDHLVARHPCVCADDVMLIFDLRVAAGHAHRAAARSRLRCFEESATTRPNASLSPAPSARPTPTRCLPLAAPPSP